MGILMKRSKIQEIENGKLSNRFSSSDLINLYNSGTYEQISNSGFPLRDSIEMNRFYMKNITLNLIVNISEIKFLERSVKIRGADDFLTFKVSKYDIEKLKPYLNNGRKGILTEVTIRKHKKDLYFIENIKILEDLSERNYKELLNLRKELKVNEWKNLILNSIGYDLDQSESILKDLMLVRLLPYLEKNYSYIELGGYSTGKTTLAEKFNTAEKIATNITQAQLYYNTKEKRKGILFSKDVLYLDEGDFSLAKTNEAKILLQVLAGNKVEVRDNHFEAERIDVSFVNQGNIENGIVQYTNNTIFDRFKNSFNEGAFLDRTNFFIAGWLIPSYFKIKPKEDQEIIPLNILEDFFKIQRKKESYIDLIEELEVKLITRDEYHGRFVECIKTTISAFLKLLYPNKEINFELEKTELEKIITLSVLGKYAIHHVRSNNLTTKIEVSYKNSEVITIDFNILFRDYIESREDKYVKEISTTADKPFSDYEVPWQSDNDIISNERELIKKYRKQKIVEIPIGYENILNRIQDSKIKTKFTEDYKVVVTYDINDYKGKPYSKENVRERDDFLYSLFSIVSLFKIISKYNLSKVEKDFIILFINNIIRHDNQALHIWRQAENDPNDLLIGAIGVPFGYAPDQMPHCGLEGKKLKEYKELIKNELENKPFNDKYQDIKNELEEMNILLGDTVELVEQYNKEIKLTFSTLKNKEEKQKTLHELLMGLK
ncbi:MAG: BREX system Lon protease-like protein BrxL [Cetobacterium sp.]